MPEITIEALLAELEHLDPIAKAPRFAEIVAEVANHLDALPLDKLAKSLHWQKRYALATALGRRGGPGQRQGRLPLALDLARDAHPSVRNAACATLGKLGDLAALPLLLELSADEPPVQPTAVTAMAQLVAGKEAADVDAALAAVPEPVWRAALARLDDSSAPAVKAALERLAAASADPEALADFGRVLRPEEIGPAYERDALLDELVARVLGGGNKSFVLVGEPGVGKTQILHALAARLGELAPPWTVLETSTTEIMIGTKYIGEWETRLGDLMNKARAPRRVILYFTNPHELAGAGTTSSNKANFLSMLGPHMRRGSIAVIGEAGAQAVQRGLDRAGQKGLFQIVNVGEPEPAAVPRILALKLEELARRAGVELVLPVEVQDLLVSLAGTYFSGLAEPGRSLKLLGEVVARRLDRMIHEPTEHGGRGASSRRSDEGVGRRPITEERRTDAPQIGRQATEAHESSGLQGEREAPIVLGADDVVGGLARVSGLPEALLSDQRALDTGELRGFFEERVLGQREAVDAMVDTITLVKAGLTDPGKPLGVLFFVGPTGVGKTEIARALAEYIYGSAERMIRLDLSEYKDYDSYEKLIGGRGVRDEGATLAARVRERPFSVILLDEIEKAHPNVFDLFLQVFDYGRLTDAHGERVDFRQAIVVMTSNLGSAVEGGGLGFGAGGGELPGQERVLREIRRFFRPEFVSRIGKIVVFRPLSDEVMRKIVRRELGKVMLRSGILRRRLAVDVDPAVVDLLLEQGFSAESGARPLKRRVEESVLVPLARAIVGLGPEAGALLRVVVEDGRIAVKRRAPARRAAAAAGPATERLRLKRPEDERLLSVRAADLPEQLAALEQRVAALGARADAERLEERKSEIVAQTAAPSFWDDAARARALLDDMVHLEERIEGLARVRRRVEGLGGFARALARPGGGPGRGRFEQAHAETVADLVELEHLSFGAQAADRRDVFLSLRKIGEGREADEAIELVRGMYVAWAERRGVSLAWLVDGSLGLLEGRSLYGLLAREEGLHRLEGGGKGADRRAAFVRVDVAARGPALPRRDAQLRRGADELVAVHAPTGTSVAAGPEVDDDLALELLGAEVEARARRRGDDEDRLVRCYGIEGRYAVDEDTGIRMAHKELLAGGLDEILRARLFGNLPPPVVTVS